MKFQAISALGVKKLKAEEGVRNKAYKDSVGILTVGVGHVVLDADWTDWTRDRGWRRNNSKTWVLTDAQVDEELRCDLITRELRISHAAGRLLPQHVFDAIVSFIFNVGNSIIDRPWMKAAFAQKTNAELVEALAQGMMQYTRAGTNKTLLLKRRQREVKYMRTGK